MKRILLRALLTCLCAFLSFSAFAQWPTSAADNLLICNHTGEQAVPKIAATSDGGCYIAWYDLASGNYDVYLQRLNADGVPQWTTPCGMLISNHTQETWITDWDMTVDLEDHCIIAVNDIRAGGDWDIYGYRISPAGVFVWGPDGIALSDNADFEAIPIVTVTSGGNLAFAWQQSTDDGSVVNLRKLTPAGVDVYNPATITLTGPTPISIPRIAAGENDVVFFQHLLHQGTEYWRPRYIFMQKYDSLGVELWPEGPVEVMTTDGIGIQMLPDLISDGSGGAYSFWYDTRNNIHHCYVQHINSAGAAEWTANGVQTDLSASELQMSPVLTRVDDGVVIFYQATNTSQSLGGVQAQKLNMDGALQWGNSGVVLIPHMTEPAFYLSAFTQNGNPVVAYLHYVTASQVNTVVRAIQINATSGAVVWDPSPRDLCSVSSDKGHLNVCINPLGQLIAVWPDSRIENGNIYIQNINPDGTLGPYVEPPPSITITSPAQDTTVHADHVGLVFEVGGFVPGIDGVVYITAYHDSMPPIGGLTTGLSYWMPLNEGESMIVADLRETPTSPPIPGAADTVYVTYTAPLPPSITITYPESDDWFMDDEYINIEFQVENFEIAETGGDGWIHVYATLVPFCQNPEMLYTEFDHYSSDPIEYVFNGIDAFGCHTVSLTLVDNSGTVIEPLTADTIEFGYGNWAADDLPDGIPDRFALHPAYPNPFNPETTIRYDVQNTSHVLLTVHDLLGRTIATLLDDTRDAGSYSVIWNGRDNTGASMPSGVYFVNMNSGSFTAAQKLMLIR